MGDDVQSRTPPLVPAHADDTWFTAFEQVLPQDTIVQAIEGFRAWRVCKEYVNYPIMRSFHFQRVLWTPGQKLVAECGNGPNCEEKCNAGIYALKSLCGGPNSDECLADWSWDAHTLAGKVWLWGRMVECDEGYRAEFAYPSAIFDTRPVAATVAKLYGVPLLAPPWELAGLKDTRDNPE